MVTSEQIKQKIEEAKTNPVVARELRTRLETGQFDTQLGELGLERGSKGLQPKTTYGSRLADSYTRAGDRITEGIKTAQSEFQAGTENVDPESGIITPAGVFQAGKAIVRGVGRTVGTVAGATFNPVLEAKPVREGIENVVENVMQNETVSNLATKASELAQRYPEAAKDIEDIVNIATVGIGKVGEKPVQELITKVGQKALTTTAEGIPNIVSKVVSPLKSATKTVTDIAQDVVPKASELRDRSIAKALRLAPVEDIATIKQSTGNDIGEFMNRFNLVKDTPGETVDALSKFTKQNRAIKQDAISLIENRFTFDDIPQMRDAVDFLKSDLAPRKSAEYQKAFQKLTELENKPNFELGDVEYVRELFDDIESIYKRTGDVRDAVSAQDKAQVIAPIRRFIEDRVQEVYPQIDIRQINNNTQTSRAIMDATLKRAPKSDTASFFQLGDLAILGVGNVQTPGLGYGALFAKKVFESPAVQLRFSRYMAGKVKAKDVVKGLTPDKLKEINDIITKELKASMDTPEIKSKVDDLQKALYKESQSTTTINKIPKRTSIPKIIPKGTKPSSDLKGKGEIPPNNYKQYSPELRSSIEKQILGDKTKAVIIDTDMIKKMHPDYNPKDPMTLHDESSALSKEIFEKAVKQDTSGIIKFIGGGAGSGKSEVILTKISTKPSVVFDGTLAGFDSAVKKIDFALSSGKKVEIYPVYTPVELATLFNKMRARSVTDEILVDTHFGMRNTIPLLMNKYGNKIKVLPYQNKVFDATRKYMGEKANKSIIEDMRATKEELTQANKHIQDIIDTRGIEFAKSIINSII